ncbi:hypothetical protein LSUE1_G005267 [Lachnellula suecica]|uniref:Uncharacterized protein n=1 Tax=Lachnellula suecica TaxID=602035 RepID=A0A8T9C5T3_9HELO|nr:hypothetical protein LSUE1_G005267 [Lachnellula suecica]
MNMNMEESFTPQTQQFLSPARPPRIPVPCQSAQSAQSQEPGGLAALTTPIQSAYNDPYDVNEPVTPIHAQRQQPRPLRRTHIEAASAGISPPPRVRFAQEQQRSEHQLTHDFDDDLATSTPVASSSLHHSPQAERRPHRALRISKNTASAILYTLEEALRHPNSFTPDLIEENAQMSDLTGGGPSTAAGNGRGNNGTFRGQGIPTTGSPGGIKGPRDIMRERQAREARKRAEAEARDAMERERAEEEAMQLQEANRRNAERRAAAAGAAAPQRGSGEGGGQRGSGGTTGQRISDNSQRSDRRSGDRVPSGQQNQPLQAVGSGGRAVGGGEATSSTRPRPTQSQQQPRPLQSEPSRSRPAQAQAAPSIAAPANPAQGEGAGAPTRSSFPHAFERWETLSAHWEGLTSYWIRRLEENSHEIEGNALSQQLSRQVTDLSAAGANLFHAVVELQRLRASSERKFQRWFFETRADIERGQEIQAMLEGQLAQERQERSAAITKAVSEEKERSDVDKKLTDMKRELAISKEEAKRAWEELGRREEAERAKIASLREGHSTLIGGVQVVPMVPGAPPRQDSARDRPATREGPYTGGPIAAQEPEGPLDSDAAYQAYSRAQRAEPADPFVEQSVPRTSRAAVPNVTSPATSHEGYSQAPAVQPASSAFYQQHQGTSLHPSQRDPAYSHSATSELSDTEYHLDERGEPILDSHGNPIPYRAPVSDDGLDEYDEEHERELAHRQRYPQGSSGVEYGRGSTTTSGPPSSSGPGDVDYSGAGYGGEPATEWPAQRHHHPTRLSDVPEEDDERSRTSASQRSRRE